MSSNLRFTFKVNGFEAATDELKAAIIKGEQIGMKKIGLRSEHILAKNTPVGATGNLRGGIFSQFHQDGPLMHEVIAISPPADVYAAAVNDGTRPHMPPSSALVLWVKQKLQITKESQAKSVAFLIARKIAKSGTKAVHMFDTTLDQIEKEGPGILEKEIAVAAQAAGFGKK